MDSYVAEARQALAAGDRQQAQQLLNIAMSLNPNNGEVWYLLGELATDANQRTEYMSHAERLGYQPSPYGSNQFQPSQYASSQYQPNQYQSQYPPQGQSPPPYQAQYPPQPMYGQPPRKGVNPTLIIVGVIGVVVLMACGFFFYTTQSLLKTASGSLETALAVPGMTNLTETSVPAAFGSDEFIPAVETANHLPAGTKHTYNSNPPTSGKHWGQATPWGTYLDAPPPDESLVHNLEHGGVIISFNPELVTADEQIQLEELYAELSAINPRVILTVRSNLDVPLAVTSWEYRLLLDSVDIEAVHQFYDDHIAQGPECEQGRCPQ